MSALKELITRSEEVEEKRSNTMQELDGLRASLKHPETGEERDLNEDEQQRADALLDAADELKKELKALDKRVKEEKDLAERKKRLAEARELVDLPEQPNIESVKEPMVYGPDSENSYVNDFVRFYGGPSWAGHEAAGKRLAEWQHQVEREIARDETAKGPQAALRVCREKFRESFGDRPVEGALREVRERGRVALGDKPTVESRAIGTHEGATATAPGEGSAFVSPVLFVSDYAVYREAGRAFANACHKEPLPPYGRHDTLELCAA